MVRSKYARRYKEEEIVRILGELEGGRSAGELVRTYGVSEATLYRWRNKYAEMDVSGIKRLRQLEAENARLKRIVADQALDNAALRDLLSKKW
jgi:putative transposase